MERPATSPPGPTATARLAERLQDALARTTPRTGRVNGRLAAVLILLYEHDGRPHLVLTKRTDTLEHHPGQVSLPGGRVDPADSDLAATALRETYEELGVAPHAVRILGRLDDVETRVTDFVVAPYIGVTAEAFSAVPNASEIARVLEVPLDDLIAADERLPHDPDVVTLRYPLEGEDVWGATARILRLFSAVVRAARVDGV